MSSKKTYKERIVIDPEIHFGKPCVAGTRILVENVLELVQENITDMIKKGVTLWERK